MEKGLHIALSSKLLDGRNKEYAGVNAFNAEELSHIRMLDNWLKEAAWCGVCLYEGKVGFEVVRALTLPLPKKCMDVATLCEWVKNRVKKELQGYDLALEQIEKYELKKIA